MARRVLVAVESRDRGRHLLEAAARLATARQAELIGFYVEELEFLQAAGLPFSKTYSLFRGSWESWDADAMERAMRARGDELRRAFESLCERRQLTGTFRTARGAPGERLLEAASEAEVVILGRSRRSGRTYTGSTARRAVADCRSSVLLFDPADPVPEKVTAIYSGDPSVLAAADEMARLFQCRLEVIAVSEDSQSAADTRRRAARWLTDRRWSANVVEAGSLREGHAAALELAGRRSGLTVVGNATSLDLPALLDTLRGPVLIVR